MSTRTALRPIFALLAMMVMGAIILGPTGSASAAPPDLRPGQPGSPQAATPDTSEAILTDVEGNVIAEKTFTEQGDVSMEDLLAGSMTTMDSGSGGTVKDSGCLKVTINNRYHSLLGSLLWNYKTWTSWCWNRTATPSYIYNVDVGWDYVNDDACWSWQGQVNKTTEFYDWAGGYAPKSGYLHRRKGHTLGQCPPFLPNNKYPENYLRSHSNGTYTWSTTDG